MLVPVTRPAAKVSPRKKLVRAARKLQQKVRELLLSPGKILAEGKRWLRLTAADWSKHVFIAGGSGNGKSKLMEVMCRQLMLQGEGLTLIDWHGEIIPELVQFAAVAGIDPARI